MNSPVFPGRFMVRKLDRLFLSYLTMNGHYTFQSSNEIIDLDVLIAGLKLG